MGPWLNAWASRSRRPSAYRSPSNLVVSPMGGVIGRTWIQELGGAQAHPARFSVWPAPAGHRPWPQILSILSCWVEIGELNWVSPLLPQAPNCRSPLPSKRVDCRSFYTPTDQISGVRAGGGLLSVPVGPRHALAAMTHQRHCLSDRARLAALRQGPLLSATDSFGHWFRPPSRQAGVAEQGLRAGGRAPGNARTPPGLRLPPRSGNRCRGSGDRWRMISASFSGPPPQSTECIGASTSAHL